jgi:hypothetical protein
VVSS